MIPLRTKILILLAKRYKSIKGGYFGRQRLALLSWSYRLLPLFGLNPTIKLIEWRFVLKNLPKEKLKILDAGCTESLFIYKLAQYGEVFGIDIRPFFEKLPNSIKFLQTDISKTPFSDNLFDCVILICVIEHIGLGRYGDPVYDNGDFMAMQELKRILNTGGTLFLTTMIGNKYVITPDGDARIYDQERLAKLINGFCVLKEEYYILRKRWVLVDKKEAFMEPPDRHGLVCLKLKK